MWELNEAIELCRRIEERLAIFGYHVALAGGVLIKGKSEKDLDIHVYPHDTENCDIDIAIKILETTGMQKRKDLKTTATTIRDGKKVILFYLGCKRIDVFFPWNETTNP